MNKELWNIFQWRNPFQFWGLVWAQLCQHVWATRNISVHFQIKYLASFLSPYQYHILKTRKHYVFDEGKRYFCFSKHCDHKARNKPERNLIDSVSGSPTPLCKKHQTLRTADCGLRTVDNGFRSTPPWKNSSAHIVIFQSFLKFAAAKREISNSSSLPLTPPYCEAWPLGGWGTWGWGGIPFESDRNVRRFPKGRNSTFWVFNIFNHKGIAYGCA